MSRIAQPHIQALLEGHTPEEVIQQVMAFQLVGREAACKLLDCSPDYFREQIEPHVDAQHGSARV
jgi:hypothetical protein